MECNKDEAKRAKQIAEEKLQDRDIIGAKKFALKAQHLYPNLDELPQFMDVINVYMSYENKQNGETNYYEILGADPLSGEELLRKKYKRRALALHPDKNKSVGADGAFKLLSQAWSILSDKEKRWEYDMKLNIGEASNLNASTATPPVPALERTPTGPTQNVRNPNYPQFFPIIPRPRNPVPHGTNPFSNPNYQNVSTTQHVTGVRPHSRPANNPHPTSRSRPVAPETFWTCCNGCKTKYEYEKIFLNQNLLCPTCQQPFLAIEIQAPSVSRRRGRPSQYSRQQQGVPASASASASASTSGSGSASASRSAKAAPASALASDRVEGSFTETQVWAAYDDDDGMPRYHALVQHVLLRFPFKMQVSWLNSKSTTEFGDHEWTSFGFTKTSGNFRAGKSIVSETLNFFSHQVKWKKGSRGAIQIFPTKGDVWALYRNWSPDWNTLTDDEVIHKYDLVVVLEDYHEDRGVSVANLVKIDGFMSVFKQRVDPADVMTIPRKEMFRFSHQVPYRVLNGLEGENAPSGCYELDLAALPVELLKVVTDNATANKNISGENAADILIYSRKKKGEMVAGNVDDAEK